jgi:glycosyltransferase involved in cell wall biosynthesis
MEILFWAALIGSAYSYVAYPLLLLLILRLRRPQDMNASHDGGSSPGPTLSFIITVRNEAGRILAKLEDTLAQAPADAELVVVSDASEDGTDEFVRSFADKRVRLVRQDERRGKEAGQKLGIEAARGDILVFSDVATRIAPGSIAGLRRRFLDPMVGAVSSEDRFVTSSGSMVGEGLYVRYEMWLRRLESRLAGLVGLSGSFFAVRREICAEWPVDVPSDFTVALTCVRRGLKAVSDPEVIGIYPDLKQAADEYARKRRTVIRGMAGLAAAREVLNPFRHGWFAFQAWSHKPLRWAVPWFLLLLAITSVILAPTGTFFALALYAQVLGYGLVLAAWALPSIRSIAPLRIGFYFAQVNLAMADALLRFLRGERVVTWEPSKR